MAITFRESKGGPLTHDELDQNFREFFFSSSYIGEEERPYGVTLYRSKSLSQGTDIYFPQAIGNNYWIQIKSGSNNVSSSHLTGSSNFQYDYDNNHLSVSGSGNFQGNLIVSGTLKATTFETVYVSSSIIQESGSTVFGNTSDDIHSFTGSLRVNGSMTGSLLSTNGILSGSIQIASDISGSTNNLSSSIASDIASLNLTKANKNAITGAFSAASSSFSNRVTSNESTIESLNTVTGSYAVTSSNSFIGTQSINGNLSVTGSTNIDGVFTLPDIANVSASIASAVAASGLSNVVDDTTPQLGGNLDLNSNTINGTGTISINGSIEGTTLNTGQGANELYAMDQAVRTTDDVQFDSLGIGTAASGTTGEIRAAGDITAYYSSDERLKDNITPISDAINKINKIGGYEFDWNSNSSHSGHDVGVIAQEIKKVLPEVVTQRDNGYLAVRYEKIVALLIEAVKEQQLQIDELKSKL